MRVHLCQLELVWQNRLANHARVRQMLADHCPGAGDLVVLPEMFPVGFSMDVPTIADHDGETERFVQEIAKEFQITLIGGNVTQPDDKGRNEALIANPAGEIIGRYQKLHPFRFANEHDHFRAGDDVITFDWQGIKVAPFICYDLRFPEVFRLATKQGAEVLVVIANWPTARVAHWTALLTARAIENQAYVIGVNRVGVDPTTPYPGRSVVIDPHGATVLDAGDTACIFACELDIAALRDYRASFPALADMRFI